MLADPAGHDSNAKVVRTRDLTDDARERLVRFFRILERWELHARESREVDGSLVVEAASQASDPIRGVRTEVLSVTHDGQSTTR
jgi:hypothetical protein